MSNNCDRCNKPIGTVVSLIGKDRCCRECADKELPEGSMERRFMDMLENIPKD